MLPLHSNDGVLCLEASEVSWFHEIPRVNCRSYVWATGVPLRESFPVPVNCTMPSASFSVRFRASGFMLRSLVHLDSSLVKREGGRSIFILLQPVWPVGSVCWRRRLLSSMQFWSFHTCVVVGLSWAYLGFQFYSAGQCVSFLQNHAVFTIIALQYNLKSEMVIPPATFLFFRIVQAIMSLLWFCMNFAPHLPSFC